MTHVLDSLIGTLNVQAQAEQQVLVKNFCQNIAVFCACARIRRGLWIELVKKCGKIQNFQVLIVIIIITYRDCALAIFKIQKLARNFK